MSEVCEPLRRLVYITAHYPPETGAAARRAEGNVAALQKDGWAITVITQAPNYPQNRVYPGFARRRREVLRESGVVVLRSRPWLRLRRWGLVGRLVSEAWFALCAIRSAAGVRADLVYGTIPYIFIGPCLVLVGKICSLPTVLEVRDLTWLYPRSVGRRTWGMEGVFECMIRFCVRRVHGLITTTQGQMDYLGEEPNGRRQAVVATPVAEALFAEVGCGAAGGGRHTSQLEDRRRLILYAGLVGYAQRLDILIEVAVRMREHRFVIAGDGPDLGRLRGVVERDQVRNVEFWGYLGKDDLHAAYEEADVLVASLAPSPVFERTQPSKLWEYMATGKPIVYAGAGEAAISLEKAGAGLVADPARSEDFAAKIATVLADAHLACALGRNGREFVRMNLLSGAVGGNLASVVDAVWHAYRRVSVGAAGAGASRHNNG